MAAKAVAPDGIWLTCAELGSALRLSGEVVAKMARKGDLPCLQAGVAWRFPAEFLDDLLAAIRAGGRVDIQAFGRQWQADSRELTA